MSSHLQVSLVQNRSAVTRSRSNSPLRLVTPDNHGHAAWAYQSSYGGGFVGVDDVEIEVDVEAGATLFLSSQASTKVYRTSDAKSSLTAKVREDATLISWPDPIVCFAGAGLTQTQRFDLSPGASLLVVDGWTAGRIANGERWQFRHLLTRLEVWCEGARVFADAQRLSSAQGELAARMGPVNACATVLLAGPRMRAAGVSLQESVSARRLERPEVASLTVMSSWPWGQVIRIAAPSTEAMSRELRDLLQAHVAHALGDDPLARKW